MKPDRVECLKKDILHHIRLEPQLYMCWDIQSVEYFEKSVNFTRGFLRGEMTPVHPCNWMDFGNMRIKSLWLER